VLPITHQAGGSEAAVVEQAHIDEWRAHPPSADDELGDQQQTGDDRQDAHDRDRAVRRDLAHRARSLAPPQSLAR
jgi:hypothetical protein